jgi:Ca2+/Na+ antiporter
MVMGAMIILLGFHWLFLPTFVVEVIPEIDMLPTWVGCVAYVVWQRKKEQEQPKKEQDNPWGDKIVIDIQEAQNVHEPRPLLTVQASPPLPPQGLDAAKKSLEERLARLNDLLEKKVITQAEYEAKRQEVLNDI